MCINSHNFGINNTKSYAFLFKDGYDCPLLWRAPKIKPPTIFCVRRSFFSAKPTFFPRSGFFFGRRGMWVGCAATHRGREREKTENSFSGFIPLVFPRKGFSPHIPAPRLFVLFQPSKATNPQSHKPTPKKEHSLLVLPSVNAIINFATKFFEMFTKKQT